MKVFGFALVLIVILNTNIYASKLLIGEKQLFGFQKDSLVHEDIEQLVLQKLDSLVSSETDIIFHPKPRVSIRYYSKDLSCLRLFYLTAGTYDYDSGYNPYLCVLYNTCDSLICPFGGQEENFSNLMKRYLPKIYREKRFVELIDLYVNTLSVLNAYYVIKSMDDYKERWQRMIDHPIGGEREAEILRRNSKEDIPLVESVYEPLSIEEIEINDSTYYEVILTTWDFWNGRIIIWKFRISKERFEIIDKNVKLEGVGPARKMF